MKTFLFLCFFSVFPAALNAQAGVIVGLIGGGALIDKAGDELNDSIDHATAAAHGLLGRADEIAQARLQQIDEIVQAAIRETANKSEQVALNILKQAKDDLDHLRSDIMSDVRSVIWEAECSGKRLLNEDLPTALGGIGRVLRTNEFELTPPVILMDRPNWLQSWFWDDPYIIKIETPFDRNYTKVRDIMEASIALDIVSDETPAHHIVATWEYIAAFALRTSCFSNGSSDVWNQEFVNYSEQARKWRNVVKIRPQY